MKVPTNRGNPANAKFIRPVFLDPILPPFWPEDPPLYYLELIGAGPEGTAWKLHEQLKVGGLWVGRIALGTYVDQIDDASSTMRAFGETPVISDSHVGLTGASIVETMEHAPPMSEYRLSVIPFQSPWKTPDNYWCAGYCETYDPSD